MTDLSDTTPPPWQRDEMWRDEPARQRQSGRLSLWLGGVMLAASLAINVTDISTMHQREPIDVAIGPVRPVIAVDTLMASSDPQVASSPPALPCVTWRFGIAQTEGLVIGGSPCIEMAVIRDGAPVLSLTLPSSPAGIGQVEDPLLHTTSTVVPGQIYGTILVMPEREPVSGVVSVVGRSLTTLEPLWIQTCPAPILVPSLHYSGGDVSGDVAANRTDIEIYGVTDYVAIGCGGTAVLHDPVTGESL